MKIVFFVFLSLFNIAYAANQDLNVSFQKYPGYSGSLNISGSANFFFEGQDIEISYTLEGLDKNSIGGIHIHEGRSCSKANEVKGHFWLPKNEFDSWKNSKWISNKQGHGKGNFILNAGTTFKDNNHRAVVIHDKSGNRVACGIAKSNKSSY